MKTGKVLLGLLAGISAGAAVGVLLAPDKGSATRKKIVRRSEEYLSGLEEKFDEFIDGVSRKYDHVKDEAANWADHGKAKAEAAGNKFTTNDLK